MAQLRLSGLDYIHKYAKELGYDVMISEGSHIDIKYVLHFSDGYKNVDYPLSYFCPNLDHYASVNILQCVRREFKKNVAARRFRKETTAGVNSFMVVA